LLALFLQSVTSSWMETDRVGDAGGKGGNLKKNRPSQDPHRLNSNKQTERQDQHHIGIQEENTSMKDIKHDGSARLNILGPHMCLTDTHSPHSLCFHFPLFPFSLFSYAHPLIPFVNTQREQPRRVLIL
jgi:hypothetical protein